MEKILVIDDDKNIRELLRLYIEKEGYKYLSAKDGEEGLRILGEQKPDLVLLDLMLPGLDGREVCRNIRKTSEVPIIMLTAKGEVFDRVLGLELGADDYVVKPFDPKELLARIRAVFRRFRGSAAVELQSLVFDGLEINPESFTVVSWGQILQLPPKEFELLHFLAQNPNRVYTRDQLLEQIWGFEFFGDSRTVDVHIKRIREKLSPESELWQIKTVWGVGYKFEVR